jgi:hypothetical protein
VLASRKPQAVQKAKANNLLLCNEMLLGVAELNSAA